MAVHRALGMRVGHGVRSSSKNMECLPEPRDTRDRGVHVYVTLPRTLSHHWLVARAAPGRFFIPSASSWPQLNLILALDSGENVQVSSRTLSRRVERSLRPVCGLSALSSSKLDPALLFYCATSKLIHRYRRLFVICCVGRSLSALARKFPRFRSTRSIDKWIGQSDRQQLGHVT